MRGSRFEDIHVSMTMYVLYVMPAGLALSADEHTGARSGQTLQRGGER
jgi:hypothetical protein